MIAAFFIILVIGFFIINGLVDFLEQKKIDNLINPSKLPEGWTQNAHLLVWEKTDSVNRVWQVTYTGKQHKILVNGEAIHQIYCDSTLVALFEADQLIRF